MKHLLVAALLALVPITAFAQQQESKSIQDRLVEMIDDIQNGVTELAPEAAELAVRANLAYSIGYIVRDAAFLVVLLLMGYGLYRLAKAAQGGAFNAKESYSGYETPPSAFVPFICMAVGVILCVVGLVAAYSVFDPVSWAAIIDPEGGLALRMIDGLYK